MRCTAALGVLVSLAQCWVAEGWPPWADPVEYPVSKNKETFISMFQQQIAVKRSEYHWREARYKCNAVVVEEVVFDWRPNNLELLKDPRSRLPEHSSCTRQYYNEKNEVFRLKRIEIINDDPLEPAKSIVNTAESVTKAYGNNTYNIHIQFTPATRSRLHLRIELEVENFLESVSDYNVIEWRPFGPLWEGVKGAFVTNITADLLIPWGTAERKNIKNADEVDPSKGYLLIPGLQRPPPQETWTPDAVNVHFKFQVWASEWEVKNAYHVQGFAPFKIDVLFDQRQAQCGAYPYWLYLVGVFSAAIFVALLLSVVGFLYYETPWRSFLQSDALADRRRFLAGLRESRAEKKLLRHEV